MTEDREIQDSPVDREAARILIRSAGLPVPAGDDVEPLEAGWRKAAASLGTMDDDGFNRALDAIEAWREVAVAEVMARVDELTAHLVDWRHVSWEARELEAGRDPHRVA